MNKIQAYENGLAKVKYPCKCCGHKSVIPYWVNRQMCSWCGHYVYKNDIDEFKDKLTSAILKTNKRKG